MLKKSVLGALYLLLLLGMGGCPLSKSEKEEKKQQQEQESSVGYGLIRLPFGSIPEDEFPVTLYAAYKGQLSYPLDIVHSTDEGDYQYELEPPVTDVLPEYENTYLVFISKSGRFGRFMKVDFDLDAGVPVATLVAKEVFLRDVTDITIDFQVGPQFQGAWQSADFQLFMGVVEDYEEEGDPMLSGRSLMQAVDSIESVGQLQNSQLTRTEEGEFNLGGIPLGVAESNGESRFNELYVRARLFGPDGDVGSTLLREKWVKVLVGGDSTVAQVSVDPLVLGLGAPEVPGVDIGFATNGDDAPITFSYYPLNQIGDIAIDLAGMLGEQSAIHIRANHDDNYEIAIEGGAVTSGDTLLLPLDSGLSSQRIIPISVQSLRRQSYNRSNFAYTKNVLLSPEDFSDLHTTAAGYTLTQSSDGSVAYDRALRTDTVTIPFDQIEYLFAVDTLGPNASVFINDVATHTLLLDVGVGETSIVVRVLAEDGVSESSYTLTLVKAGGSSVDLSSLFFDQFNLTPAFDPGVTDYSGEYVYVHWLDRDYIPFDSVVAMTAVAEEAAATFSVVLDGIVSGGNLDDVDSLNSVLLQLPIGDSSMDVTVHSEDGSADKTYTIDISHEVQYPSDQPL